MKRLLFFLLALGFLSGVTAEASVERTAREVSSKLHPQVTEGPRLESPLASLSESFEGSFPPAGWTKISLDGGPGWNRQTAGTAPIPGWNGGALTAPPGGGTAMAFATWNTGGPSTNDQWLVTPQLSNVLAGDSLRFWLRYWPDAYTDTLRVLISTTGSASGDFTVPVATLGFGLASDTNWVRYAYRLTDFVSAGSNIYIAFREKVIDNLNDGSSFSLDLVEVGAPATMVYDSSTVVQPNTLPVPPGGTNQNIIAVKVNVTGTLSPLGVTSITFNTTGTTSTSDLANARVFYTGTNSAFSTGTQFGSTVSTPSGSFVVTGSQALEQGANYFWLAYDIAGGATTNNVVDGECTSITVDAIPRIPTVTAPAGNRLIQQLITIGAGTLTARFPLGMFWGHERSASLYTGAEMGTTANITSVAWYIQSLTSAANGPVKIYLKTTASSTLTSVTWADMITGATLVYDDTPTFVAGGYQSFAITPFEYGNLADNLLVLVETNFTGTGGESSTAKAIRYSTATSRHQTWLADNAPPTGTGSVVSTRPNIQMAYTASSPMAYQSSTTSQNSNVVLQGAVHQQIIGIQVVTAGALSPIDVTQFNLSTNGTTNTADISNAKVFYTGTNATFSAVNQFGSTNASPSGAFNVTGTQTLASGTNYFWLTYDIAGGAALGNVVDAECASVTVDGTPETPTITAPAGNRLIAGSIVAGDYTVGVSAFNEATGRNLRHERFTRIVKKTVPVDVVELAVKQEGNAGQTASAFANVTTQVVEVEEEYWVLTENGIPYSGPLVASSRSGGNSYATITAAFDDLNVRGVSGHVRFLLVDASYPTETYPLTINVTSPNAPSASATVTVKPAIGVSPSVSGSFAGPIFRIVNTNYVTLDGSNTTGGSTRDWTITNGSATSPNVIHVGSVGVTPITNTTIKNCILINGAQTSSAVVVGSGTAVGDSGYFNAFTLENNSIQRAYIGAYINGGTSPAKGVNVVAAMNNLDAAGANSIRLVGLYTQGVNGANFSQNTIANFDGVSSETDRGIWCAAGTINSVLERNEIHSLNYTGVGGYGGHGIELTSGTPGSNNIIRNNFIYNLSGDGWTYTSSQFWDDGPIGILVWTAQSGVMVYNNSIYLYGNTLNQTDAVSMGIAIGVGTNADVRNNAIVNNQGLLAATGYGAAGLFVQDPVLANLAASTLDNNNYFVNATGSGANLIAKNAATDYATLALWQAASGQEASSVEGDPLFTSASDLHIANAGSPASNAGVSLAAVTDDFDGDVRGGTPDIGADEFTGGVGTSVITGWNIVSNPVTTATDSMQQLFPTSLFSYGFKFVTGSGYAQEYKLANGTGYWAKFPGATGVAFSGSPRTSDSINVVAGWNLIGSISSSVDTGDVTTSPSGILASNFFGYPYSPLPASIDPGKGYWIKANASGKIYLEESPAPANKQHSLNPLEALNSLTITDAQGGFQTLYFGTDRTGMVNAPMFVMPPAPPSDAFDARFESADGGRMLQLHDAAAGIGASFPVRIQSTAYPLTLTWKVAGGSYELVNAAGQTLAGMEAEGTVQIPAASGSGVTIRLAGTDGIPAEFALMQNYPNPFNPSTTIRFGLPVESRVTVHIYNTLGQRVRTLVNENRPAGYHATEWNGTGHANQVLGSGVYFVRVDAAGVDGRTFTDLRKMMLMK